MQDTKINWTEFTWNPASGCTEASEGCKYCYAKIIADSKRGSPAFPNGFDLTIRPHKLREPYRIKQPSFIFVNSMSDLFWDQIPDDYRDKIIDVIADTPQHRYQVLTKRPEIMLAYSHRRRLPPNMWCGVSVENQRNAGRVDILRRVDVPVRFVSAEPLIGEWRKPDLSGIHWLITGGESGRHLSKPDVCQRRGLVMKVFGKWVPRPDRKDWIRHIRDACLVQDVAFWHKQWGGPRHDSAGRDLDGREWNGMPADMPAAQLGLLDIA